MSLLLRKYKIKFSKPFKNKRIFLHAERDNLKKVSSATH